MIAKKVSNRGALTYCHRWKDNSEYRKKERGYTHLLESADRGTTQNSKKKKQASEKHLQALECKEKNKLE